MTLLIMQLQRDVHSQLSQAAVLEHITGTWESGWERGEEGQLKQIVVDQRAKF